MAWTDSDTVKKFLPGLTGGAAQFKDVAVTLDMAGSGSLPHTGILSGSEVVKRHASGGIDGPEAVALPAETWIALPDAALVSGELVVGDGWQLTTVYEEGRDFLVNAAEGKIRRIDGGGISAGATVQVWYQKYEVMVNDIDYTINYSNGTIALTSGSEIPAGATLKVDYELNAASSVEDLIPEAITQAEDKILRRLKSDYTTSSTDQGLITGATELTLAIICRSLSVRALGDGLSAAQSRGKSWLDLASQFERSASRTLKPFMTVPAIARGGVQGNFSWEWA